MPAEANLLAHAVSNHFTENVVFPFKSVLELFKKYSDFPTFTGLADFASIGQDGQTEAKPVAPYALILFAPRALRKRKVSLCLWRDYWADYQLLVITE